MKKFTAFLTGTAALATVALASVPAHAASFFDGYEPGDLVVDTTCALSDVTVGGSDADACEGVYYGNDKQATSSETVGLDLLNNDDLFGDLSWSLKATDTDFTTTGSTTGTWSLSLDYSGPAVIALKGGPTFNLYYFENFSAPSSGTFSTLNLLKGNGDEDPGLSHFSLYTVEIDTPPPSKVPEPMGLLGTVALGVGAAVRRRK